MTMAIDLAKSFLGSILNVIVIEFNPEIIYKKIMPWWLGGKKE
jgi:hypothetical protein